MAPTTYDLDGAVPDDRRTFLLNRVSWGAIFAGVAAALMIQLLLNILGLGVGASSLSVADTADNPTVGGLSMTAAIWWVASGVIASFIGGLVAGRLCGAGSASTARWHGFVSWCVTTLVVFYLLTSAIGGLLGGTLNGLGSVLGGTGKAAASAVAGAADSNGGALQAQVKRLINPNDSQAVESDVAAYVQASVNGNTQAAQAAQGQAVNDLARVANISPDEAKTRIDQAVQSYKQTAAQAKDAAAKAAEATRQGLAQAGLYGFGALLLGAIAAFIGGGAGTPRRASRVMAERV